MVLMWQPRRVPSDAAINRDGGGQPSDSEGDVAYMGLVTIYMCSPPLAGLRVARIMDGSADYGARGLRSAQI
eukprot:139262-Lingulodinium_polyedra.AAC.1